jgi:SNF2 family DNA or RNA helicase
VALREHQQKIVEWLAQPSKARLLFADAGVGKTAAVLHYIKYRTEGRALIVAPPRVSKMTWPTEAEKWHPGEFSVGVLTGRTPSERERILAAQPDLVVVSYHLLPWLKRVWDVTGALQFETVVFDESDCFKGRGVFWKAAKTILRDFDGKRIAMTGTPVPNHLLDLWPQAFIVDRGKCLGTGVTNFRFEHFRLHYNGYEWIPNDDAEEQIYRKLKPITLRVSISEVGADFPEVQEIDYPVELSKAEKEAYLRLEKTFLTEVDGETIFALNSAVASGKLRQVCGSFLYGENGTHTLGESKDKALDELVESLGGQQAIVAYWYEAERDRLLARPDTTADIAGWLDGRGQLLALHPASAGHGLNLQVSGAKYVIFYTLPWSAGLYQQTVRRLQRLGQRNTVIVYRMLAKDTLEESRVAPAVREKLGQQERFLGRFE